MGVLLVFGGTPLHPLKGTAPVSSPGHLTGRDISCSPQRHTQLPTQLPHGAQGSHRAEGEWGCHCYSTHLWVSSAYQWVCIPTAWPHFQGHPHTIPCTSSASGGAKEGATGVSSDLHCSQIFQLLPKWRSWNQKSSHWPLTGHHCFWCQALRAWG